MSELSYMDKLLDGVEVEWIALGDVCDKITSGKNKVKSELGLYPVFGSTGIIGRTDTKVYEQEQILVARVGANAGRVNIAKDEYDVSDNTLIVQNNDNVILKFLYYYLVNMNLNRFTKGAGQPLLTAGQLKAMLIPIPPLNIQAEIVRILDAFTELTAELTAELVARKQQYAYYREQLLTFEEGEVEWKALGEIAEYSKARISHELLNEGNYVGVNNLLQDKAGKEESSHVPTQGNSTKYQDNDILIGNIRPYLKKIWQADCIGGTNGDVLVVHPTDEAVHPRYLYQVLADDNFFNYNMQHAKGAKMPRGDKAKIMEYKIPIPPLAEQERIVAILDKFDALTTSLTEGLPREIALRQQQYEYYRELLLSFPKPEVANHD